MRTRRGTLTFLVVILILVSLYWNYKLLGNKGYTRSKSTEEDVASWEFKKQISIHAEYAATDDTNSLPTTSPSQVHVSTSNPYLQDTKYDIMQKLLQLEAKLNQSHTIARVVFVGSPNVLHTEVPIYEQFLQKHGYTVQTIEDINDTELSQWSGLMCYIQTGPGQVSCLSKERQLKLRLYQKVSYIPGLVKVLFPLESFCYTMSQTQHIPVFLNSPLSVPCYVLPLKHTRRPKKSLDTTGKNSLFLIRTLHHGLYHSTFVKEALEKRLLQDKGVIQIIQHPLLAGDLPVIIKLYVITTSMFPLRIYRHQHGKAMIMKLDKGIKEAWSLDRFYIYLSKLRSNLDITKLMSQIDNVIVNTLMVSESLLSSHTSYSYKNAFQLLEFHFTFNSSLHPFVLEVKVPDHGSMTPSIANDTVNLLFNVTSSSGHVTEALEKLKDRIGVEGVDCRKVHSVCLTEQEMVYLLESHREASAHGRFKKLYPTCDGQTYQPLLNVLQSSNVVMVTNRQRGTPQLHHTLMMIENHGCLEAGPDKDTVRNIDLRKGYWETDDDSNPEKMALQDGQALRQSLHKCKDDPTTVPVLTDILIEPSSQFNPAFNSDILEYKIVFPFEVMVVKVWGKTSTCWSEAKVNGRVRTSKEAVNFSLGVGWNKLVVHLLNISPHHQQVISTYSMNIYRRVRSEGKTSFYSYSPHEMCTVKQDCDLKVFPSMPCGPKNTAEKSFEEFQSSRKDLPLCHGGDVPGSWVLPCAKCGQPDSCYWNKALWIPQSCQHRQITTKEAKTCLAKKKILFVGDSTNRGMMYYLMEKINGSLRQWEKTHSMKVYSSALNDDQTSVSFAYYPQFWLPAERKPVFLKALHHLMAKFMPLENSTNTILVVGGVQWLLSDHVIAVKTTLHSLGLSGIKVIIKTLGSGFHLPVPGLVQLNLEGHQRVLQRNQLLIQTAKTCGFEVVDTYSMTVVRYKEFLMGKCGCHFHKVVNMKSHTREIDGGFGSALDKTKDEKRGLPRYHVIGPINSAYADIMISRMCS